MKPALFLIVLSIACTTQRAPEPRKEAPVPPVSPPPMQGIALPPTTPPAQYLAVFLHGIGDNANGFASIARALKPALPRAELLVPDGFDPFEGGGDGRQWFSRHGLDDDNRPGRVKQAGERVSAWLDAQLDARKLAHDRVVLIGFSQGAIVSLWLATHRRPAPLAVAALSGRYADDTPVAAGPSSPVLLIHGARDAVIPVAFATSSAKELEARGVQVMVRIHTDLAHGVDDTALRETRDFLTPLLPK
jgi:phospholipase/carboxylesterase